MLMVVYFMVITLMSKSEGANYFTESGCHGDGSIVLRCPSGTILLMEVFYSWHKDNSSHCTLTGGECNMMVSTDDLLFTNFTKICTGQTYCSLHTEPVLITKCSTPIPSLFVTFMYECKVPPIQTTVQEPFTRTTPWLTVSPTTGSLNTRPPEYSETTYDYVKTSDASFLLRNGDNKNSHSTEEVVIAVFGGFIAGILITGCVGLLIHRYCKRNRARRDTSAQSTENEQGQELVNLHKTPKRQPVVKDKEQDLANDDIMFQRNQRLKTTHTYTYTFTS